MATAIVKYAGTKYAKSSVLKHFSSDDVYFEEVKYKSRFGKMKTKKIKKRLPPGLTPVEEELLKKVKKQAYRLDMALFNLGGVRFGWSSVVGIIPGVGDVVDLALAYMLYRTICEANIPQTKKTLMILNMGLDGVIGLAPVLGDFLDGVYKCNTRNAAIESDQDEYHYPTEPPPEYSETNPPPKPARPAEPVNTARPSRGWFGRNETSDVEAGNGQSMTEHHGELRG